MAADGKLAEVARYALWRLRIFLKARRRDHRQQIPDPGVRGRRDRAGLTGARRRPERHRRDVQYRALLLLGQEPGVHLRHCAAVRLECAPDELVDQIRRWAGAAERTA